MKVFTLVLGMVVIAVAVMAAAQAQTQRPKFEVASVKRSSASGPPRIQGQPGGRFTATNTPLKMLLTITYAVPDFQIIGGLSWITTDKWNIEARAAEGFTPPPPDGTVLYPITPMVQSLIEDRFQLKMHRETRDACI
jgi:uncharacterized protein (TIGR03435 family)